MTSKEFVYKVNLLKREWRRGLIADDEYHQKIAELRTAKFG